MCFLVAMSDDVKKANWYEEKANLSIQARPSNSLCSDARILIADCLMKQNTTIDRRILIVWCSTSSSDILTDELSYVFNSVYLQKNNSKRSHKSYRICSILHLDRTVVYRRINDAWRSNSCMNNNSGGSFSCGWTMILNRTIDENRCDNTQELTRSLSDSWRWRKRWDSFVIRDVGNDRRIGTLWVILDWLDDAM